MDMGRTFDLMMCMGQSNMAGRGITSDRWPEPAAEPMPGIGYEYRAVTDPDHLHGICEPFGVDENDPNGIYEPGKKTGSMVTAFANAYVPEAGVPIIAVSASKGGSSITQWHGDEGDLLADAIRRCDRAQQYAAEHGLMFRHRYMLWCQGETDGDRGTSPKEYKARFHHLMDLMHEHGIEACFLITIGEYNGPDERDYASIRQAQLELASEMPEVHVVCDELRTMRARGLMKDRYHYYQQAYNEVGTIAGRAAGVIAAARG